MQVCSHCGKESRAIDRYCLHCGQRLDVSASSGSEAVPFYVAVGEGGDGWDRLKPGAKGAQNKRTSANGTAQVPMSASTTSAGAARAAAPAGAGPSMRLVLQTAEGPREFALDGRECSIGRAPTCDVVLAEDQLASRRHALLRYEGGHYSVVDLGSSNGTYVNGIEIREATALADGDRISVGEHEVLYTSKAVAGKAGDDSARQTLLTTDGLVVPAPPPWPPASPRATDPRITAVAPSVSKPAALPPATPPAALPDQSPAPATDIEELRVRLVEASEALAQRLESSGREAAHLRAAIGQLAERAQAALTAARLAADSERGGDAAPTIDTEAATARLDALAQTARQTAENPRHLDYLTALAERSAEIAQALEAQRGLITALDELRARLVELSGPAHQ